MELEAPKRDVTARPTKGHTEGAVHILQLVTLKSELSSSAWLMLRLVAVGLFVGLLSRSSSVSLLGSSFFASEGLRAPNMSKLIFASRICSSTYGTADSFRLPITCLAMSRAASCYNTHHATLFLYVTTEHKAVTAKCFAIPSICLHHFPLFMMATPLTN